MVTLQQVDCFIEKFKTLSREGGDADLNISSRGGGLVVMLSLHLPNVFSRSSNYPNQRTPVKPKEKRKNDDIPCKAWRKAKRALDRAKSAEMADTAIDSSDVMVTSDLSLLHSAEMVDKATYSAAVTAAGPQPSNIPSSMTAAVMADSDPAQLLSADMVETTQLSSAEMVEVIPTEFSVMIDKTLELAKKAETSTLLPTSAEMVASTSQLTKQAAHNSSEKEVQAMLESHYIIAVREHFAQLHDIVQEERQREREERKREHEEMRRKEDSN